MVIIKFGSVNCAPRKKIKVMAEQQMEHLEKHYDRLKCINISIDESMQLYGELKRRRIVNGVPVIVVYDGNQLQRTMVSTFKYGNGW